MLSLLIKIPGQAGPADQEKAGDIRIATYNIGNYAVIPRKMAGESPLESGKPESERNAVARMIAELHPDILGIMEIGDMSQFEDLRSRLKTFGKDYPYSEYVEGSDPSRHIALLSRLPITQRLSRGDLALPVGGIPLHSPRGILDVSVETSPGHHLRILCVHLKAKLAVAEYDESRLREAEAKFVRKEVREILRRDPAEELVVMGDFNDGPNSPTLREIEGKPEWRDALHPIPLSDERGETWTEFWSSAEVYSRIDHILVSSRLLSRIDLNRSGIARPTYWKEASDHCPLFTTLKGVE